MTLDASSTSLRGFPVELPSDHRQRLEDPFRLHTLDAIGGMGANLASEALDRLANLASQATGAPIALVSFVDGERQVFASQKGVDDDLTETPLTHSLCQYVVSANAPLAISDARGHPLLGTNGAVEDLGVTAYLGVPIRDPHGQALGSFCSIDTQPREWTERERDILADLAAMVETELRLRREVIERDLLSREMNHRIKNLFSLVGGIVSLSARKAETPAEVATIVKGRLQALSKAHEVVAPKAAATLGKVDGPSQLEALAGLLIRPHLDDADMTARVTLEGPDVEIGHRSVTSLALALHELATNASKYGCFSLPEGRLHLSWAMKDPETLAVTWRESGVPPRAQDQQEEGGGFGSRLIDLSISGTLRGSCETAWGEDGLVWTAELPLSILRA